MPRAPDSAEVLAGSLAGGGRTSRELWEHTHFYARGVASPRPPSPKGNRDKTSPGLAGDNCFCGTGVGGTRRQTALPATSTGEEGQVPAHLAKTGRFWEQGERNSGSLSAATGLDRPEESRRGFPKVHKGQTQAIQWARSAKTDMSSVSTTALHCE